MHRAGRKVADAFNKVSYEEKHALMMGMAKFPEAFVQESLKEKYQGSNGRTCDACGASVKGMRCCKAREHCCHRCTVCNMCAANRHAYMQSAAAEWHHRGLARYATHTATAGGEDWTLR